MLPSAAFVPVASASLPTIRISFFIKYSKRKFSVCQRSVCQRLCRVDLHASFSAKLDRFVVVCIYKRYSRFFLTDFSCCYFLLVHDHFLTVFYFRNPCRYRQRRIVIIFYFDCYGSYICIIRISCICSRRLRRFIGKRLACVCLRKCNVLSVEYVDRRHCACFCASFLYVFAAFASPNFSAASSAVVLPSVAFGVTVKVN